MTIKLLGARRTATNATAQYINKHLNQTVNLTARHAPPQLQQPHANKIFDLKGYAVTVKGPYAWLASMTRWCHLEDLEDYHRLDHQLLECWALKHEALMRWTSEPHVADRLQVFHAEAWATTEGGDAMLADAAATWSVDYDDGYEVQTRHHSQVRSGSGETYDPTYYTQHRYVDDLGDRVTNIKHLLQRDWVRPIVEAWGYSVEPPR